MEEHFTKVVHHIFGNWTALRLAVDHSMGGPNSRQTAIDCMNYMVNYCLYEPNLSEMKIEDALEDILDEEFDTVCEDDSPKEVATLLFRFAQLVKSGNIAQSEIEYQNLPSANTNWTNETVTQPVCNDNDDTSSEDEEEQSQSESMEQDGWTEVKPRRRK